MSWYNVSGNVFEEKFAQDLYLHDAVRIPNWPTQQAAQQHPYSPNAAQIAALDAMGVATAAGAQPTTVASPGASASVDPGSGVKALTGWSLSWAGAGHFMLRLAEGAVGLLLLAIGLNALLHNPAGKAAGTAARAAVRI